MLRAPPPIIIINRSINNTNIVNNYNIVVANLRVCRCICLIIIVNASIIYSQTVAVAVDVNNWPAGAPWVDGPVRECSAERLRAAA